jgi:hypothetical protein
MSMSLSQPSSGTATNPTRQQLDELDALLQRMLDLPVNKLENLEADRAETSPPVSYTADEAGASAARETPAPKIDFQALKQHLASQPAAAEGEANDDNWVPLSSTWQPSALTWKPLAQSWKSPGAAAAPQTPAPETEPGATELPVWEPVRSLTPAAVPAPADANQGGNAEPTSFLGLAATADGHVPPWAWPLVWFNGVFDRSLMSLGPPGRVLRSRTGRFALAVVGLGCLVAAAVVLFVDWIGWTS